MYVPYFILIACIIAARLFPVKPLTLGIIGCLVVCLAAGAVGMMSWIGLIGIAMTVAAADLATNASTQRTKVIGHLLVGLFALALSLHYLKITNYRVFENLKLSEGATPFTLYANFDKGLAGFVLLVFFCKRIAANTILSDLRKIWFTALIAIAVIFSLGVASGWIAFQAPFKPFTGEFLIINLFLVCVAEEAFFRGFLQELIYKKWPSTPNSIRNALTVFFLAMIFGLLHFNAAITLPSALISVGLVVVLSVACGQVYALTRRIEYPIFLHFTVNAIHYLFFSYPTLLH